MTDCVDLSLDQIEALDSRVLLLCSNCGRATTALEARLRNFYAGRCGICGGLLQTERGACVSAREETP
jgi:hypothetical protein